MSSIILGMQHTPLPAKQERSRRSLERLLDAAEEALKMHGLDGATVPRIAAKAGLSPGAIYRRFPDKDALMREVLLRYHSRIAEKSRENLARAELWKGTSLRQKAYVTILSTIAAHEAHAGLLRALYQMVQRHPDRAFRRRAFHLEMANFRGVVDLFLQHRDEIDHPDPELAITTGLLLVAFAMREQLLDTGKQRWSTVFPRAMAQLDRELPRMFLRYLGVKDPDAPPEPHPMIQRLEEFRAKADSEKSAGKMKI
jgi:AcrR family transcriptional regulator